MSGNWVTGSEKSPIKPSSTMKIEITVDSTGLLINVSNFIVDKLLSLSSILYTLYSILK